MKAWLLPRMLQSGRVYTHAHTYTFMREHMNIHCFGKASPTQSLEIQLALGSLTHTCFLGPPRNLDCN